MRLFGEHSGQRKCGWTAAFVPPMRPLRGVRWLCAKLTSILRRSQFRKIAGSRVKGSAAFSLRFDPLIQINPRLAAIV